MSTARIVIPSVVLPQGEPLQVLSFPPEMTKDERMASLASLISAMNRPFVNQLHTVEYVYNLLQLGVSGLDPAAGRLSSMEVTRTATTRGQFLGWVRLEAEGESGKGPSLPALPGTPTGEAAGITQEVAVYAALATLLFCLGRQASESARASVMDNRPDALIRRFNIREEEQVLLPGRSSGPCREALEQIYNAFANYTELRSVVVSYFIGLKRHGAHLPLSLEILMTNFQLMRGAGMTHVDAVIKLAQMHPWTLREPKLRVYYEKFCSDLAKFQALPEDIRPYHRLLVAQSDYLFLSAELRPLIAVAGSFIEEVEKTFGGYVYNRAAYQSLVEEIQERAPNYKPTSGVAKLASLLNVADEPLPTRTRPLSTPASSTV